MGQQNDPLENAIKELPFRRTFRHLGNEIVVAFLIRSVDWRPLHAPWWSGKEVCIIGADLDGNFLLRHCDGTVRYWCHKTQSAEILSLSVKEFASQLI